jgi:hypothetical protein
MFIRLDSAFYAPKIELSQYYHGLVNHTKVTGQKSIILPSGCRFGGYCDRFAVGLSSEMSVYFNHSALYNVVSWAYAISKNHSTVMKKHKQHILHAKDCGSETMLMYWLRYISNIYNGQTVPNSLSFITLRSMHANKYCNNTRAKLMKMSEVDGLAWTDKSMAVNLKNSVRPQGFDLVLDPLQRCGEEVYRLNATELCLREECMCEKKE